MTDLRVTRPTESYLRATPLTDAGRDFIAQHAPVSMFWTLGPDGSAVVSEAMAIEWSEAAAKQGLKVERVLGAYDPPAVKLPTGGGLYMQRYGRALRPVANRQPSHGYEHAGEDYSAPPGRVMAWDLARHPSRTVISTPPGIGKTALWEHLREATEYSLAALTPDMFRQEFMCTPAPLEELTKREASRWGTSTILNRVENELNKLGASKDARVCFSVLSDRLRELEDRYEYDRGRR